MNPWNTRLDEEQQLLFLQDTVVRRKNMLEQQRATFGLLNVPPHIQIEIEHLEEELSRLTQRLTTARRRKRHQQTLQQAAHAARGIGRLALPSHRPTRRRKLGIIQRLHVLLTRLVIGTILIGILFFIGWWQTRSEIAPVSPSAIMEPQPQQAMGNERRIVANTGGIGVKYRQAPQQDAPYTGSLNDGATVFLVEGIMDSDGVVWWKVQLQDGTLGYIKEQYLRLP